MANRQYTTTVRCPHEGCREFAVFNASTRWEQAETSRLYADGKWRCVRHAQPREVLSAENPKIITEWSSFQETYSRFWGKDGSENGFAHGPGFKAFAEDFPEGTTLRITAEVILPNAQNATRGREMSEMVERVMQKMRETGLDCEGWDAEPLRELARAAIEAMRDPTEAMKEAGAGLAVSHSWSSAGEHIDRESASDVYGAMIVAALR